jgi:hypothetical protein
MMVIRDCVDYRGDQRRADQHRRVFRASLLPPAPGLATVLVAAELGADRLVRSLSLVLSVAARSQ